MSTPTLIVYGTSWCRDVARSRALLDRQAVPYAYIDVEEDPLANERCAQLNGGVRKIPTLVFESGLVLIEPSDADLSEALAAQELT